MTESVTQMRAAMLHAPGDLRLEEVALPQAGPDDVLVRIATNGLCGSDIHFYKEGRLGPFVVDRPYIPGELVLSWRVGEPRVIGLARLPRLLVSFRFTGLDEAQRYAFMRRFDLYMQRGGG